MKYKHKYMNLIAEHLNSSSDCMVYFKCETGKLSQLIGIVPIESIEDSADWVKVVEKDFEVLSGEITIGESLNKQLTELKNSILDLQTFANSKAVHTMNMASVIDNLVYKINKLATK